MIEIFDNILDISQSNRYDQEVSKLKWSYEYQPTTTPLNMHWYSDGELFIYDLLEDLMNAIQLKGLETVKASYYHTRKTCLGLSGEIHLQPCTNKYLVTISDTYPVLDNTRPHQYVTPRFPLASI